MKSKPKKLSKKQKERNRIASHTIEQRDREKFAKASAQRMQRLLDFEENQKCNKALIEEQLSSRTCKKQKFNWKNCKKTTEAKPIFPSSSQPDCTSKQIGNLNKNIIDTTTKCGSNIPKSKIKSHVQLHRQRNEINLVKIQEQIDFEIQTSGNQRKRIVASTCTENKASLLRIISIPTPMQLLDFESNIEAALLLFHENGGLYRFQIPSGIRESEKIEVQNKLPSTDSIPNHLQDLSNEIGRGISNETKERCINTFQTSLNYHSPLLTCGSCGIRTYTTQNGSKYNLEDGMFDLLRLNTEAIAKWKTMGDYKKISSVFVHPNDSNKIFYLHPEFIQTSSNHLYEVYICTNCSEALKKSILPKFSIANGYDFGRMERISSLEKPSLAEILVIAQIRLYITEIKFIAPSGVPGSKCLKGHTISFPHDGPVAAADRLNSPNSFPRTDDIEDFIGVKFVGTDDQFDAYIKRMFSCSELRIRFPVVIEWIKVLKTVNPLYATILIDDSVSCRQRLADIEKSIIERAKRLNDETSINVEKHVGSDIAGVHWHVSDNNGEALEQGDPDEAILEPILVTDSNGIKWLPDSNDHQVEIFEEINRMINSTMIVKKTSNSPINEFLENDRLILGAFPHLFILGQGVPSHNSIPIDLYEHYLGQFTTTMATSSQFQFFLSNQRRRHATATSVSSRVKNTPEAFDAFDKIVNSQDFKDKSAEAIKDPRGKAAQFVIKTTEPYIQMCGKKSTL